MKNLYMKKVTLLALALISIGAIAQTTVQTDRSHYGPENPIMCGQHIQQEKHFQEHPEHKAMHEADQAEFQTFYDNYLATEYDPNARSTYIVPVVVHVVHLDGADNISDEQIEEAMVRLNDDFNETNSDLGNTVSAFQGITGNPDVEFKLATRDPNGQCHRGITRTYSANTVHDGGSDILDDIQNAHGTWPQNRYLNVIVCQDPAGAAGYTNTPGNWYNQNGMGGSIYMRHDYMGTIGTSSMTARHTLSHEVGHWLNLSHCWGSTNDPGQGSSCGSDDGVNDTPNTIGWTACNTSGSTCSSLDNVQNIMEYSYCSTMFTDGQAARVDAALNSSTAGRNKLWNNNSPYFNLTETGTDGPGDLCEAAFSSNFTYICAGQSIDFSDESFHNVTSRTWAFTGGTPSTSSDADPTITYNTPGVYAVSLEVTDGSNIETETQNNYVVVLSDPGSSLPYSEDFESIASIPDNERWMVVDEAGSDPWILTSSAGSQESSSSAKLLNYGNSNGTTDELISGTIDLSGVDAADDIIFNFDYAYRKRYTTNDEWLKFYISKDCGSTWVLRKNIHGDDLSSVLATSSYTPQNDEDWYTVDITNISSDYYESDFRFKFVFESDNGNNMYIDNINLYPSSMAGLIEVDDVATLNVYPNPTTDITNIQLAGVEGQEYSITVLNSMGQQVHSVYKGGLSNGLNSFEYNTSELAKGIYIVRIESEGKLQTVKLIKE
ncbi:MAG: PKD repeat protein [Arenicella sp.]|jgi:PKD repeat protein